GGAQQAGGVVQAAGVPDPLEADLARPALAGEAVGRSAPPLLPVPEQLLGREGASLAGGWRGEAEKAGQGAPVGRVRPRPVGPGLSERFSCVGAFFARAKRGGRVRKTRNFRTGSRAPGVTGRRVVDGAERAQRLILRVRMPVLGGPGGVAAHRPGGL